MAKRNQLSDGWIKTLAAGDLFVRSQLIADALLRETDDRLSIQELELQWPLEPFGRVAEVDEAAGTEDQMIEALSGVEVAVTQMAPITRRVLDANDSLRLIVCTRGGPVNINVEAASDRKIPVCYAPGRNATAAAEYTIGLILSAMRRISEAHKDLSEGDWRGDLFSYDETGIELDGKTIGLVGYGAVGSRVAKVLRAFGSNVLVYDPYVERSVVEGEGCSITGLDDLLDRSQVVSLHARLTPGTEGMIGRAEIGRMPAGSVLVNTARGGLLDYDAMCDALDTGHLGGAALDVYREEPLPPGSRLYTTPRLVLSPHLAGASKETALRAASIAAAEVGRYVRGENLKNVANREAVGGSP